MKDYAIGHSMEIKTKNIVAIGNARMCDRGIMRLWDRGTI